MSLLAWLSRGLRPAPSTQNRPPTRQGPTYTTDTAPTVPNVRNRGLLGPWRFFRAPIRAYRAYSLIEFVGGEDLFDFFHLSQPWCPRHHLPTTFPPPERGHGPSGVRVVRVRAPTVRGRPFSAFAWRAVELKCAHATCVRLQCGRSKKKADKLHIKGLEIEEPQSVRRINKHGPIESEQGLGPLAITMTLLRSC